MSTNQWDQRYDIDEYVYGTEPNDFLREQVQRIPANGKVLCLADGEGRNGVFLARCGYEVTSVDASEIGLSKARKLAALHHVELTTECADLANYDLGTASWDAIVSIFCHVPPVIRQQIHRSVHTALRPGGVFILEAYTPDQPRFKTGGPPESMADHLMSSNLLINELINCNVIYCRDIEREIHEGSLHNGHSTVVQCIATTM